jgi:hypothetical protein
MSQQTSRNSSLDPYTGKNAFGLFTNIKLEVYSLFAIAVLGVFFKIFIGQTGDMTGEQGPATSTLWGYGITSVCLLCILFIVYGLAGRDLMNIKNLNQNIKDGFFSNSTYILGDGIVFVVVLIMLTLILVLNYVYYKKINIGLIPESFTQFTYVSNLFIVIQFLLLFQYINLRIFKKDNRSPTIGIITASTYFLSTINIIFVVIMYILLKYYSTDG